MTAVSSRPVWRPGDWILLRSVYRARVRWARPHAAHTLELFWDDTWAWKDEDDFAEAIALGVLTDAEAAVVRAEGERVIATLPDLLPTGWEDWRPDPAWQPPDLPAGWDAVEP